MSTSRRGRGPVALAAMLSRVTGAALRKRGFAESAVVTNWAEIVGPELAADTQPQKLVFPRGGHSGGPRGGRSGGTLHVRVVGALATELQHLEPLVIERINTYFGYQAVVRLALVQGPLPPGRDAAHGPPQAPLDAAEESAIANTVADIADDSLRRALAGLGRSVKAAEKAMKTGRDG